VKSSVLRIGIGLLCAIAAVWSIDGKGENAMKSTVFASERPPIDRAVPVKLETATFALG
jgi:hypothetical protein